MNFSQREQTENLRLPNGLEAGIGFGAASLVLGLMSIGFAVFIIGAGLGLLGLILALIHLARRLPFRGLAIAGLILSIIGGVAGAGMGAFYTLTIRRTQKLMAGMGTSAYEDYYGKEAPDVNLNIIDGNTIKLSDLKGKRVMLDFWATWCPPCKKEIPHIVELRKTISPDELVIIGISAESKTTIQKFARDNRINYPLASADYETDFPEPFKNVMTIPMVFLIDANGVIETAVSGYQPLEKLKEYALGTAKEESPEQ